MPFKMGRLVPFGLIVASASLVLAILQGWMGGHFEAVLAPDPMAIEVEAAFALEGSLWLDARSRSAYEQEHLEGALLLNEDEWEAGIEALLHVWSPDQALIVYCDGGGCAASREVALRLQEEFGMEPAYWLMDGWDALKGAGKVGR